MKRLPIFILPVVLLFYILSFLAVDRRMQNQPVVLEHPFPEVVYRTIGGYLTEMISEILFIRSAVFIGGVPSGTPPEQYVLALGQQFDVMSRLHPYFIDPYYYASALYAPLNMEAAEVAAVVLKRGVETYPNDIYLHLFKGYNYNFHLDDPLQAARVFDQASQIPNAPIMFKRLSAIFSARGGNLAAGRALLQIMLAAEENPQIRTRYQKELLAFDHALVVENAIALFRQKYFYDPITLSFLVPDFLEEIPYLGGFFVFDYRLGELRLVRPN